MTIPEYDVCDCGKRGPHSECNTITDKLSDCVYIMGNAYFEMGKYHDGTKENKAARELLKKYRAKFDNLLEQVRAK